MVIFFQAKSYMKMINPRNCGCGNAVALAVDRLCEILPGKKTKKEIFKEITRRSLGCTGKSTEFNGSKLRGVHLSLVKLDDSIKEKLLGK